MSEPKPRRQRAKPAQPPVHVRNRLSDAPRGLRELPDNFNALAQGERPRRAPPKVVLRDDRMEALIPGVANRDARAICDARIERLIAARDSHNRGQLSQGLAEVFRMGLWRGRNLISFDALLEDVLGLRASEGRTLAEEGAAALSAPLVRADDRVIATWIRAEAGLIEAGSQCRVELHGEGPDSRFVITVGAERADLFLAEIGKRVVALSKFLPQPAPPPVRRAPRR